MRAAVSIAVALVLITGKVWGQELVAIRPGVMCHSAEVLAKLTLPNGDSRTHSANSSPEDLALAASGGCIDIPQGARVTVHQQFHNTSIVSYGTADARPYVVPNIDFQPLGPSVSAMPGPPSATGSTSTGYAVVQRLPTGDGSTGTLVLLEDARLTPKRHQELWGKGDVDIAFDEHDPLVADVRRRPLLNARLQLLSPTGVVLAETRTEYPLAKIEAAPIHGLPTPAVLFTVDESIGMGGFNGPATTLLSPATTQLTPVQAVYDGHAHGGVIGLASTLHAGWRIVPARRGGPQEIESAYCPGGDEVLMLWTYRFHDGQWHRTERRGGVCGDLEGLPPRNAFP